MTMQAEVLGDESIGRQKALRVAGSFEPLHPALSLPSGLVRVLGAVVEVAMLPMFYAGENLAFSRSVTLQFVGDNDAGNIPQALEELAEELLRSLLVSAALDQDIEHVSFLIDGSPQIVMFAFNRQYHFIEVPLVTRPWTATTELIRIRLAKLAAPFADRFIRHDDATFQEELFYIPKTQTEAKVQPHSVAHDLDREAVMFVFRVGTGNVHAGITSHPPGSCKPLTKLTMPSVTQFLEFLAKIEDH